MRLRVTTSTDGVFEVANFDPESALDFREALDADDTRFLMLDMDGGSVLINRDHIVSVEFD